MTPSGSSRDDLRDGLRVDGLDVHRVGHLGVRHDGRGVRVDEHHPDALLSERTAGLRARIVELGGLADLDWSAADEQYRPVLVLAHTTCVEFVHRNKVSETVCCSKPNYENRNDNRPSVRRVEVASM